VEVEAELEEVRRRLEEVGPRFCEALSRAELDHMERFMEHYAAGRLEDASRVLESLGFMHDIASKICVREGR